MAKLRIPAVGIGLLLFIAAGLAGVLFIGVGNGSVGAAWALAVLLGVVVALTVVAVVRNNNTGRAGPDRVRSRLPQGLGPRVGLRPAARCPAPTRGRWAGCLSEAAAVPSIVVNCRLAVWCRPTPPTDARQLA